MSARVSFSALLSVLVLCLSAVFFSMPPHRPPAVAFFDRDGPRYAPQQPSSSSSGRAHTDAGPKAGFTRYPRCTPYSIVSHLPPGYARRNPDAPGSAPPVLPVPRVAADVPLADVPLRPTAPAHPPGSPLRPPMSSSQVGSTLSLSSTLRGSLRHGLDSSLSPLPSMYSAVHVHTPATAGVPVPVPAATPTPTPIIWLGPTLTLSPWPMPASSMPSVPSPSSLSSYIPSSVHPSAAIASLASDGSVLRPAGSMLAEVSVARTAADPHSDSNCHPPGVSPVDDG